MKKIYLLNITEKHSNKLTTNKHNKSIWSRQLWAGAALAVLLAGTISNAPSQANPTGGSVTKGAANIVINGATTSITQTTKRAVINWDGFNIATTENVEFNTPDHGATLNNINGGQSQILGHVTSNGTLYFVNQNGFVFGPQSNITAQNLVISTQTINAVQFAAQTSQESQKYNPPSNLSATIILSGAVSLANHGAVAVIAPHIDVASTAKLLAPQGTILLAGGIALSTDISNNGGIGFEFDQRANTGLPRFEFDYRFYGASVVNNGSLDTSSGTDRGGAIILTAQNGTTNLSKTGTVNVGNSGTFTYNQNNRDFDIAIDQEFVKQINYQPSMNLILSSGRDVIVTTPLRGDKDSRMNFTAGQGITINSPIQTGGLTLKAVYVRDYHDLTLGAGGLNIVTTGTAWHTREGITLNPAKGGSHETIAVSDGGDIFLSANNGGQIYISNPISARNIVISSDNGGIGIYEKITATNQTGLDSKIVIYQHHKGNVWLQGGIESNNIGLITDNGSITIFGAITANFPDFDSTTQGILYVNANTGNNDITLNSIIFANDVRVQTNEGDITFADNITSVAGASIVNKLQVITDKFITFDHDLQIRKGGTLNLQAYGIAHNHPIHAEYADSVTIKVDESFRAEQVDDLIKIDGVKHYSIYTLCGKYLDHYCQWQN